MQSGIMGQLLQAARLDRMAEQVALDGPTVAYSPLQFLTDLRAGVWSELAKPGATINIYRRNLQRAYLDNMDARLNGTGGSTEVRVARARRTARARQAAAGRAARRHRRTHAAAPAGLPRRDRDDARPARAADRRRELGAEEEGDEAGATDNLTTNN